MGRGSKWKSLTMAVRDDPNNKYIECKEIGFSLLEKKKQLEGTRWCCFRVGGTEVVHVGSWI